MWVQSLGQEDPMNRGAWWAIVHRVTKSRLWLKHLSTPAHTSLPQHPPLRSHTGLCHVLVPLLQQVLNRALFITGTFPFVSDCWPVMVGRVVFAEWGFPHGKNSLCLWTPSLRIIYWQQLHTDWPALSPRAGNRYTATHSRGIIVRMSEAEASFQDIASRPKPWLQTYMRYIFLIYQILSKMPGG